MDTFEGRVQFEIVAALELGDTYENSNWKLTATGDLGKGKGNYHDFELLDKSKNEIIILEVKKRIARCGESDLKYNEEGKLLRPSRSKTWFSGWDKFLEEFNSHSSIFSLSGNYQLEGEFSSVAEEYFKDVSYLITCDSNDNLIAIPANEILSCISFKGSEIRRKGKNAVKVFTPNHCHKTFVSSSNFLEEHKDFYIMKPECLFSVKGRGGESKYYSFEDSVYKIEKLSVEKISENKIKISKNKIKQLNSNISIHMEVQI